MPHAVDLRWKYGMPQDPENLPTSVRSMHAACPCYVVEVVNTLGMKGGHTIYGEPPFLIGP